MLYNILQCMDYAIHLESAYQTFKEDITVKC